MLLRSFFSGLAIGAVGTLAIEHDALAFCRSTTCTCTKDEALPQRNGLPQSTCGQATGECPRDEHGCKTSGIPVAWGASCIGFSPNLAGTSQLTADEYYASFDAAFQAWALADCGDGKHPSIQVLTLRPTSCAESDYNPGAPNVNSVYFTDNGWIEAKSPHELDSVIAKTKTHFVKTGEVVDADIAINSARHDFSVSDDPAAVNYDLISVMVHEVGHFLGLDHSDVPQSVMYWQYSPRTLNRVLREDDVNAICAIYPPAAAAATCDPTPKGGLEESCGPQPELKPGCDVAPGEGPNGILPVALTIMGVTALRMKMKRGRR